MSKLMRLVLGLGVVVSLAGCSVLVPSPERRQAAVKERAEARWASILGRDDAATYAFLTPATRDTLSLEGFKRRVNLRIYRSATVKSVECPAEDVCSVVIDLTYASRMGNIPTSLKESWVRVGWSWYFVLQD